MSLSLHSVVHMKSDRNSLLKKEKKKKEKKRSSIPSFFGKVTTSIRCDIRQALLTECSGPLRRRERGGGENKRERRRHAE